MAMRRRLACPADVSSVTSRSARPRFVRGRRSSARISRARSALLRHPGSLDPLRTGGGPRDERFGRQREHPRRARRRQRSIALSRQVEADRRTARAAATRAAGAHQGGGREGLRQGLCRRVVAGGWRAAVSRDIRGLGGSRGSRRPAAGRGPARKVARPLGAERERRASPQHQARPLTRDQRCTRVGDRRGMAPDSPQGPCDAEASADGDRDAIGRRNRRSEHHRWRVPIAKGRSARPPGSSTAC